MTGDRLTTTLDYKAIQLPRNDGYNPNGRPRKAKYNSVRIVVTCLDALKKRTNREPRQDHDPNVSNDRTTGDPDTAVR